MVPFVLTTVSFLPLCRNGRTSDPTGHKNQDNNNQQNDDSMNPSANMGWGQGQGQGPGSVCGPNGQQLSVVATVWGVTTSTQSAPMGTQGGYGMNSQMGGGYCNPGNNGSGGGNAGYSGVSGQMAMTKGSYGSGGGTGRHMGPGYAGGGYVYHEEFITLVRRFWGHEELCLRPHMPQRGGQSERRMR